MSDYRNLPIKLPNKGLDVTSPPDTLEEGRYTILQNVKNSQEGVVTTRDGLTIIYRLTTAGEINTIRRLDSGGILFGTTTGELFRNEILLTNPYPLSGNPLTTVRFHASGAGASYLYIGDIDSLFKIKSDGTIYKWGITAPFTAPTFTPSIAGNLNGDYDWRFTYFSSITGAESNGSPIAPQITLVNQQAAITAMLASTDPQVDQKRIYRRGGTITDTWQFVAQITNNTLDYLDNFSDDDIAENEPLSEDNEVPFTTVSTSGTTLHETPLPYIFGPFIGKYILGCGDPNRPGYVYWTNPDAPDSASSDNSLSVTDPQEPLQGGFIFNENPYVWTRDNLFTLDYGGPDAVPTFIPRLVSIGLGLSTPYAYCIGNNAVYFMSKDGIYATDCQSNVKSVTNTSIRPIFLGREASDIPPIDYTEPNSIRLFYASQEIHFFYKTTPEFFTESNPTGIIHLVYDLPFDRWRRFSRDENELNFGYGDENQAAYTLLLTGAGIVYTVALNHFNDATALIKVQVRTGSQDAGVPLTDKEWGVLLVDADLGDNFIQVTPYLDAETSSLPITPLIGASEGRRTYCIPLGDTYSRNIAFDFNWSNFSLPATLYQLLILFRIDEEPVTHWEHPETSHGLNMGWMHVRDAFFCLRSTSDVILTHTIDGLPYTYTLPSTGGERRRIHVYLAPTKGKVFKWELNSANVFKLYGEDSQIFLKPWNSAISYQPMSPFTAVGQATFLRKEAGT